jgi:hypothetical protein
MGIFGFNSSDAALLRRSLGGLLTLAVIIAAATLLAAPASAAGGKFVDRNCDVGGLDFEEWRVISDECSGIDITDTRLRYNKFIRVVVQHEDLSKPPRKEAGRWNLRTYFNTDADSRPEFVVIARPSGARLKHFRGAVVSCRSLQGKMDSGTSQVVLRFRPRCIGAPKRLVVKQESVFLWDRGESYLYDHTWSPKTQSYWLPGVRRG